SLLGVHLRIGTVVVGVASPGILYEGDQNDPRDQSPRDPKECLHGEVLPVSRITAQIGRASEGERTRRLPSLANISEFKTSMGADRKLSARRPHAHPADPASAAGIHRPLKASATPASMK